MTTITERTRIENENAQLERDAAINGQNTPVLQNIKSAIRNFMASRSSEQNNVQEAQLVEHSRGVQAGKTVAAGLTKQKEFYPG